VAAEVHATKPAGFIEMGDGPFQALTAEPEQAQPPLIGLGNVAADGYGFKIQERLIAVIALIADDLLSTSDWPCDDHQPHAIGHHKQPVGPAEHSWYVRVRSVARSDRQHDRDHGGKAEPDDRGQHEQRQ